MKRHFLIIIAVLGLASLAVVGLQTVRDPGADEAAVAVADAGAQLEKGKYLARAGNCMACHTARGGEEYAGGRAINTPFGAIYAPNVTPDQATGIGSWTADDFWRALHNGKSKDGSFLYPAFPYPNYTKMVRADSDALYAYFRTIRPVRQANREHTLAFPYNQRVLLAFWRALYFTPGEFQPQANQTAEWNRGAYLVQGLGHCSACHASRSALGGSLAREGLGGGLMPDAGWYAPALTPDPVNGLGEWQVADIASLLKTGVSQRGAAVGPMAEVVSTSLQHVADSDVAAMAIYLKTLPKTANAAVSGAAGGAGDPAAVLRLGAKLYEQNCASCHGADGKGAPPAYPSLAGNRALALGNPTNPIRIVLNGGYPPGTAGNPRPYGMPPFGAALSDSDIAAVVSYIRAGWRNDGQLVSPLDVSRLRGAPAD
ncbi:c-type cytochrome [Massilia sp. GCM10020059]|uniref:Cytochrome c n=1 Tax=Massilia agrisoli TaxID=2892444 RepID=A0ABS8IVT4_9BURK|nr:cytochrome c [Massilia agrisoli]MCC6071981.1 cytochrome c [Massilia agrisoli]